ncbi:MAG TPA: DUF1579 domain-containing protein [Phycisphaerales bacterium]|nr:DUF1579 domain-containing protein [Phycisphaerales bacterium]
MKLAPVAAALVLCSGLAVVFAQPEAKPASAAPASAKTTQPESKSGGSSGMPTTENMKEMQEAMAEAGRLAPEHIELAKNLSGDWTAEVKSWMGPDMKEPMTSTGTARFEPIMGARFIRQSFEGKFGPQTFKGEGTIGYHKKAKKYQSTWIDNMSTGTMLSEGEKNASGEIVFNDDYTCPMDGTHKTGKSIMRFTDRNHMTFEMWSNTPDGQSFKAMEINYTRAENTSKPAAETTKPAVGPVAPSTTGTPATAPTSPAAPKSEPKK